MQEANWGAATVFRCLAGSGGGTDTIGGFRIGIDTLSLQGVGTVSEQVIGGSANIALTDNTSITLTGVADLTHLFG